MNISARLAIRIQIRQGYRSNFKREIKTSILVSLTAIYVCCINNINHFLNFQMSFVIYTISMMLYNHYLASGTECVTS